MNIISNLIRIVIRTRSIVFLFIVLLFLDGWIYFYYPQYKFEQDVQKVKKSFTNYFDFVSEIINEHSDSDVIIINQVISYLKYNPDFRYIAAPISEEQMVYPAGLIQFDQLEVLPINAVNHISEQQVLSFRLKPSLKYDYDFEIYYLGVSADIIVENLKQNYKDAILLILLSLFLFSFFIVLFFLDFYKPSGQLHALRLGIKYPTWQRDEFVKADKGIQQLNSRLVNRKRELKSVNNILAATIKSQRNFIKVISHDLKAPLRNVSGLVDSIQRKYSENLNSDITHRLERIKKNVDNERQMISDILRNITNQKKILTYEKVDVQNLIDSILDDLGFEIQDKNIDIKIEDKLPSVYSNQVILRHVFQNLLDNACNYFSKTGKNHINISCKINNSEYIFSVMDTGPGISKEMQKTLFHTSEFNQPINILDNPNSGLGLQLVSTFIEIINGKIWLNSEIGKGSTFYISLNKLDDTKAGIFQ